MRALWVRQAAEKLAAGPDYTDEGWVVVDEVGAPVHPEWFSDEFGRLLARAGLPRGVLHEARHTALSILAKSGVPAAQLSAWAGHHGRSVHACDNYVHVRRRGTSAAGRRALGELLPQRPSLRWPW